MMVFMTLNNSTLHGFVVFLFLSRQMCLYIWGVPMILPTGYSPLMSSSSQHLNFSLACRGVPSRSA